MNGIHRPGCSLGGLARKKEPCERPLLRRPEEAKRGQEGGLWRGYPPPTEGICKKEIHLTLQRSHLAGKRVEKNRLSLFLPIEGTEREVSVKNGGGIALGSRDRARERVQELARRGARKKGACAPSSWGGDSRKNEKGEVSECCRRWNTTVNLSGAQRKEPV